MDIPPEVLVRGQVIESRDARDGPPGGAEYITPPLDYIPARHHVARPKIYKTVFADPLQLKAHNKGYNWRRALFDKGGPGYYFAKFPQRPHIGGGVEYMDLVFTLPSERSTHNDFHEEHAQSGCVELTITKGQLFPLINDKIDVKRRDFHIMPKHIVMLDAYSTLPVSFDVTLNSRVGQTTLNCWSQPHGITNVSDPTQRANKFTHLVLPPGHNGELPQSRNTMFVASDEYNSAEFAEYINVDFDNLRKQLAQLKYMHDNMPTYRFICPLAEETNFSLPFWFLLNEWSEIRSRTAKVGWNKPETKLNHILKDGQNEFLMVSAKIMNDILDQRAEEHRHSKYLMNLTEVTLQLKPLLGQKGWEEYRSIAKQRNELFESNDARYARFMATVRIAYERFDGAAPDTDDIGASLNNLSMKDEVTSGGVMSANPGFWS